VGAERVLAQLEDAGISLKAVTDQVLREGIQKFAEPFDKLIHAIEAKREVVAAQALTSTGSAESEQLPLTAQGARPPSG
jgi:hypothetical protein